MNKKILVAITIAIILGAMALPVLAKPPDHFFVSFAEAPFLIADCGDYEVWTRDYQIYLNGTIHYDKEGNSTRIIQHWSGDGFFWSPETGKEVYMDSNLFNSVDVLETGDTKSAGVQFRLTIPGEGTILMDVGRIIFNPFPNITFEAGQHPVYFPEEGATDKLCAWFAE